MRAAFFLCALLLTSPAQAAFDVFLQLTPTTGPAITGNATDPLYAGWIEATSFAAGAERGTIINPNGSVSAGQAKFKSFTLVKKVGASTASLYGKLTTGALLSSVKMVVVQRSPNRVEMWDINATTCLVQELGITASTGEDSEVEERITFLMVGFEWSYIQLKPNGDPLQEHFASFDLATQTGASGSRAPTFAGGVDTDGDGIPDGWELYYGLNRGVADGALDSDGDGLDNLHEYIAHTDPLRSQSTFRITALQQAGAPTWLLTWQSVANLSYRVESAPSPGGPWTFVRTVASAGTGTTTTTVNGASPQTFYRVLTP